MLNSMIDYIAEQLTMATLAGVVTKFYDEYNSSTPKKLKIIDAYLTYIFFTGVVQFVYCCLVGTFPFNAFLSGFISSVASFVLGVCLRLQVRTPTTVTHHRHPPPQCNLLIIQVNPANKAQFAGISHERAFADFIFAHVILHLIVMNFIG